jgi:hypothetical protein
MSHRAWDHRTVVKAKRIGARQLALGKSAGDVQQPAGIGKITQASTDRAEGFELLGIAVEYVGFSADNLSAEDRVSYWRELFGRQTVGLDIEPLRDAEFFGGLTLHALPGLKICRGITSGGHAWRTPELPADNNNDISLWVNLEDPVAVSRRGEEIVLGEQEAVLGTLGEVGGFTRRTPGRHLCLQIPRAAIAPLVPAVDDAVARRISRDSTALRLLASYADTLHEH